MIQSLLSHVTVGYGTANCYYKDVFKKATGRKIALTRALSHKPREFRKLFWNAYLKVAGI